MTDVKALAERLERHAAGVYGVRSLSYNALLDDLRQAARLIAGMEKEIADLRMYGAIMEKELRRKLVLANTRKDRWKKRAMKLAAAQEEP